MEYRKFDKLECKPSLLGFGGMRFPKLEDGSINEIEAEKMLDHALANGVNYIDTAYGYHDGNSEKFIGKYLSKIDRKSIYLATKLPLWAVKVFEDVERLFTEQQRRLKTDYFDFYLLHAVSGERFDKMVELGVLELLDKYKAEGKIKYLGFSFHDSYEAFERVAKFRNWDFCQIQLNYMDTEVQAGIKGYELATSLGIPVVIMEPAKGGALTTFADDIVSIFKNYDQEASVASWAFRWVASLENVKVVLSGMSTLEQVDDNLKTFVKFKSLNAAEQKLVNEVVEAVKSRVKNGCTNCRYCMPCPFGVDIPRNFAIWNEFAMYDNRGAANWHYYKDMKAERRADMCQDCGACEAACPQAIQIRRDLKLVTKDMEAIKL